MNLTTENMINLLRACSSGDFEFDDDWVRIQGRLDVRRFNAIAPHAQNLTPHTAVWLHGDREPQEWWRKDEVHFYTARGAVVSWSTEWEKWRKVTDTAREQWYATWSDLPESDFPIMLHPGWRGPTDPYGPGDDTTITPA